MKEHFKKREKIILWMSIKKIYKTNNKFMRTIFFYYKLVFYYIANYKICNSYKCVLHLFFKCVDCSISFPKHIY